MEVWRRFFGSNSVAEELKQANALAGDVVDVVVQMLDNACKKSGGHFNDSDVEALLDLVAPFLPPVPGNPEKRCSAQAN